MKDKNESTGVHCRMSFCSLIRKSATFISFGIILYLDSFSQGTLLRTETKLGEYYLEDTLYSQIDFCYSNQTDSTYVLWIEKENIDLLSDSGKIKKYFYTKRGDWRLIQLILDGNVSGFVPEVFYSFIKVIRPGDMFNISFVLKGNPESTPEKLKALEKHIMIVYASSIKGFPIDSSIEMFNYKGRCLTIFENTLRH